MTAQAGSVRGLKDGHDFPKVEERDESRGQCLSEGMEVGSGELL